MANEEMDHYEKVLGLKNLGKLAQIYENNHHLIQLLETDILLRQEINEDYSSGERKAFKQGLFSILIALEKCFIEVENKTIVEEPEK